MLDFLRRLIFGETKNLPLPAPVVVSAELPMADEVKETLTSSQQKTEGMEGVEMMEAASKEISSLEADLTQEYFASSQEPQNAPEATQPRETRQSTQHQENEAYSAKEEPISAEKKPTLPAKSDFVNGETNLEVIGYFDASYKRRFLQPREKKTVSLSHGRVIHFIPSSTYGLPNAEDQDFYRAFQKILEEYWQAHPDWMNKDPIVFPTYKLLRYAKKKVSGRDWKAVHDWVHRQEFTGIEGSVFLGKKKGYAKGSVGGMFTKALTKGEELPDGKKAEMNYIWLASWYAANIRENHYTTLLDRSIHFDFKKATAKVLSPILFYRWYATNGAPAPFAYSSLAQRLGLPPQKYLAKIKHQLDSGHQEMNKTGILAEWNYEQSADGKDWNIIYAPGQAYFAYQKERRARRLQAKQVDQTKRQPSLPLLSPLQESSTPTLEGKTLTEMTEKAIEVERIKKEIRNQFGKQ